MPASRSLLRDAHLFDSVDREKSLGGLVLSRGVTNANFYVMVEVFVFPDPPGPLLIRNANSTALERNNEALLPGKYYVDGPYIISNETVLTRTISISTGTRVDSFKTQVRERDGRCVITGERNLLARIDDWTGFQAAHVFPLAYLGYWRRNNFSRWITKPCPPQEKINSVQNGLLLNNAVHARWDNYHISINPKDNHKIVCFLLDAHRVAGNYLDAEFLEHPDRAVDELLWWHFRQSVLANMRGEGEPLFEHDFPPGSDMIGEVMAGPKAAQRMEAELFGRFAVQAAPQGQEYGYLDDDNGRRDSLVDEWRSGPPSPK